MEGSLLLLLLHRPYEPPATAERLTLTELAPAAAAEMARALLSPPVERRVVDVVASRAEGNPLYVEELARHLSRWAPARAARSHAPLEAASSFDEGARGFLAETLGRLRAADEAAGEGRQLLRGEIPEGMSPSLRSAVAAAVR